jgi:ketosteroid isomerase-like protein
MSRVTAFAVAAVLSILLAPACDRARAAPPPPIDDANAGAIRAELARSAAAWNRRELDGFLDSYEHSPLTTFVGKDVTRGFDAIRAHFVERYGGAAGAKMGTLSFTDIDVRPLAAGWALAIGRWHLARPAADGGDAGGLFTLTMRKTELGWRILVDHTS